MPPIWDAQKHDFCFEIELWNTAHGNSWDLVKAKLPAWLDTLKLKGFRWDVWQTWSNARSNPVAREIQDEPKRINAYKSDDKPILNQQRPQDEGELINLLVSRTKEYADLISSLKP